MRRNKIKIKRKIPWKTICYSTACLAMLGLTIGFSVDWNFPKWIFISGSSTMQPLLQSVSNIYNNSEVVTNAGGSSIGIQNVIEGKKNIGNVSKTPSTSIAGIPKYNNNDAIIGSDSVFWENEKIKTITIAWDGIGIVYKSDINITITPTTVKWLYLAFCGYTSVDINYLLPAGVNSNNNLNNPLIPFARQGGASQSGTAEAFVESSRLLKDENQKYNAKVVLSKISATGNNIDSSPINNEPSIYEVLQNGTYGLLTKQTNESNLQTWQAVKEYSGPGIPITYLSAGFIKNNYKNIIDSGFKIASYSPNDNGSNSKELITIENNEYSNKNVANGYDWYRPLNFILSTNSPQYVKDFVSWVLGNLLFPQSKMYQIFDYQGYIPLDKSALNSMFVPRESNDATNNTDTVFDIINTYAINNPNSDYDIMLKNTNISIDWTNFWNSYDYKLITSSQYNERSEIDTWYGAYCSINS